MQYRDILDRLVYSGTITEQESEIIFREAGNPKPLPLLENYY